MPRLALSNDSIRAAIDPFLTATALADSVIALDIYSGMAWDDVLQRDPLADGYAIDSIEARRVKRATEYFIAARLAQTWRPLKREIFDGRKYEYEAEPWDAMARAALLQDWAEEQLAAYLNPDGQLAFPIGFTLAHGCRGR